MKKMFFALGFLGLITTGTAFAAPSAIPGQACSVNWENGACGNSGPAAENGSPAFVSCRSIHRDDPCACGNKGRKS